MASAGCGVRGVEGHYVGSTAGSLSILGIPILIVGDIAFDLLPASGDLYDATGNLVVRRKTDGQVTYEATLSGSYGGGALALTFTAKDGKSTGTMQASALTGHCWNNGTWTITGLATSGAGTWNACR
jgi:hypothetical protein